MAFRRSIRSPRTSGVSRRQTSWAIGPRGAQGAVAVNSSVVFPTGSQATESGLTIVRIRGSAFFHLASVDAVDGGFARVGFGICIVSENASAVGITAIPTPLTDVGWDGWMYHRLFALIAGIPITDLGGMVGPNFRFDIDGKAMRKEKETDVVVGVVEYQQEQGTADARGYLDTRLLVKLS